MIESRRGFSAEVREWNPETRPLVNLKVVMVLLWLMVFAAMKSCATQMAYGQVFQVRTDLQVCRIASCEIEVGTASSVCIGHIGDRYYFLSAGHACYSTDPRASISKLQRAYIAIDQQWVPCQVDGFDNQNVSLSDVAVFSLVPGKALREKSLAEMMPPIGSEVVLGGFPSGSPYAEVKGVIRSRSRDDGKYDVSTAVVRGVSGGPAMYRGDVVGIVSASDFSDTTVITGVEEIRRKVSRWLGRLPDCGRPSPQVPQQSEKPEKEMDPFRRDTQTPPPAPPSEEPNGIGQAAGAVAGSAWTYLWPVVAGALGLSGPIGIGVYMAGRLIASRIAPKVVERVQERIHERRESSQQAPTQVPVIVQGPSPPQIVVTEPTFVPYETPNRDREAWEFAMREIVKKYPGAVATIETLKSLRDQYLILNPLKGTVTNVVSK